MPAPRARANEVGVDEALGEDGRGVRYTPAYNSREYQSAFQSVFQDSPLEDFALHDILAQAGVPLTFDLTTDESTEKFVS